MRRKAIWVALACAVTMACNGHRAMTPDFGKANGAWLSKQPVNPGKVAQPVSGLDSQEASIIAQTYRKSLAPKDAKLDEKPQVLLLQQDEHGRMMPKALAPSVPKE